MIKLAIIGCTDMLFSFIYDYLKHTDFKLVGICDFGKNTISKKFSQFYVINSIFDDHLIMIKETNPDAVLIFPDDNNRQFQLTEDCLKVGVHVLCERPVVHSRSQMAQLIQTQKKSKKNLFSRYNRRFIPTYLSAKKIISSKEFGNINMYYSSFHAGEYDSEESFIFNHISHHIDLAILFFKDIKIEYVAHNKASQHRFGFNILFSTPTNMIGIIQANSYLCGDYPMERVEICGDYRQVIIDNIRNLIYNKPQKKTENYCIPELLTTDTSSFLNMNYAQLNNFTYYGFENMLLNFSDAIKGIEPPLLTICDIEKTFEKTMQVFDMIN